MISSIVVGDQISARQLRETSFA